MCNQYKAILFLGLFGVYSNAFPEEAGKQKGHVIEAEGMVINSGPIINTAIEKTENKEKQWHEEFLAKQLTLIKRLTTEKVLITSQGRIIAKSGCDHLVDFVLKVNGQFILLDDHGSTEYTIVNIDDDFVTVDYHSKHWNPVQQQESLDEGQFRMSYRE